MTPASLHLEYLSSAALAERPDSWWRSVLGLAGFERLPGIDRADLPTATSMTPPLRAADHLCEVWRVSAGPDPSRAAGTGRCGAVHYRHCEGFLFGSIAIDERTLGRGSAALLCATSIAYRDLFATLGQTRHPHLIRVWNYLPEINRHTDGDERYRHFNRARLTAFRDWGHSTVGAVPAACALGSPAGSPLSIYFLASRRAPMAIENPRQTSAYHYPPKYGSHAPTFSRACSLGALPGRHLFVSGTASIVGHETLHPGDVAAQTRVTLENIGALVEEANRRAGGARYSLDGLAYKIYARRPGDLPAIEQVLDQSPGAPASRLFLQADICREELLVEIEASVASAC
jgi:enamine deaminase RidA (YjgF/YER057c/UK114 family)